MRYWKHGLALVLFVIYSVIGGYYVHKQGRVYGEKAVLEHCYYNGGMLWDNDTGHTIGCGRLTKEET